MVAQSNVVVFTGLAPDCDEGVILINGKNDFRTISVFIMPKID